MPTQAPLVDNNMEKVARHLLDEAMLRDAPDEKDVFGRSVFNRYYYATFLNVKEGLSGLKKEWEGNLAHASIPDMLRGQIQSELKKGLAKAKRASDPEVASLCSKAITATKNLATLMEQGRTLRVTADYHPEVAIDFSIGPYFHLNKFPVEDAKSWAPRAKIFVNAISHAWKQVYA
jgi:hypothetical protein